MEFSLYLVLFLLKQKVFNNCWLVKKKIEVKNI